jgi:glucose/arabinose dehydrogenase
LSVAGGLHIQIIAHVSGARELAILPNGDLLVATGGSNVDLLPLAQSSNGIPAAHTFVTIADPPDSGIAFSTAQCAIYVAGGHGVYRIPYSFGDQQAQSEAQQIASVRTGPIAPNSDGDVHRTTSVAFSDATLVLYASVGSSCNACAEVDPTRAVIEQMTPAGGGMTTRATRIRNAIALTADPASGQLWAGGAGQDNLASGHPYEFLDDVSTHAGVADYGWPDCEENHVAYTQGAQCGTTVAPSIEFPAYSTLIGATFYPQHPSGANPLPASYRGGIFVTRHGSWHTPGGCNVVPEVDFVPMHGDLPVTPVNWSDPTKQWQPFVTGFQPGCNSSARIGRPTGVVVGTDGSLFVGDDATGAIYRIRP